MTTDLNLDFTSTEPSAAVWAALRSHVQAELADHVGPLTELGELFHRAGHELALVGGPVRDAVMRRTNPAKMDLDLTTSARPEETLAIIDGWAHKIWEVGREFGTIAFRRDGQVYEVTTYRHEEYQPSSRKPKVTFGDTLAGDLIRRDFTINAMAVQLPQWDLVDPHGGLADVLQNTLRTPAPAVESFDEDPLRMMRAARFVSQLQVAPDDDVVSAMRQLADRLAIVSVERVQVELVKLIEGIDPRAGLKLLVATKVAHQFLPEVPGMQLSKDEHHQHKDVYEHSLTVLQQAIALEDTADTAGDTAVPGPDFVLRFAALMHDIAKPATRKVTPEGKVSFHHHEVVGAKMVAKRMRALKFDTASTKAVARLVELHLRFHGYGDAQWSDSAVRRYVTDAGPLLGRLHKLTRADCTTRNKRKAARLAARYDNLEKRIAEIAEKEELASIRPDIDGKRIMELLGKPSGPVIGRAYQYLLNLRMEHGPLGAQAAEEKLVAWWADQPESTQQ